MSSRFTFGFNWRESTPHCLFLLTFHDWRPADDHPVLPDGGDWRALLQEPPEKAIERFLAQGCLTKDGLHERMEFHLTAARLKEMLQEQGLPVSGNKSDLILRLLKQVEHQRLYDHLPNIELLRWSDYGRSMVEQWMAGPQTITHLADSQVLKTTIKILKWLIGATVAGVLGNAAYDLLKRLDESAAREIKRRRPLLRTTEYTDVTAALRLEWRYVPTGPFLMGSAANDRMASDDEKPQHLVHVPAFYLGKYPVTNRQYQVFVRDTGHRARSNWDGQRFPAGKGEHPVVRIYWSDAVAFCQWAKRLSGVPIRLLTEAEWEKGARGVKGLRYPWGNDWRSGYSNSESRGGDTTPVGRFPLGASPYGALDMIGNVWEWTSTLHRPYPYQADDGRENLNDVNGWRVARGGSFWSDSQWSRAASRIRSHYDDWSSLGFRVGWSAPFSRL